MATDQHVDRPTPDPRDAFTELGRLSFENTSIEAMLQRVAVLAKQIIPGTAEASVSLIANDKASTAAYTGRLALDLDETQYGRGYGPSSRLPSARRSGRSPTPARRRAGPTTSGSLSNAARSAPSPPLCRYVRPSMAGSTCTGWRRTPSMTKRVSSPRRSPRTRRGRPQHASHESTRELAENLDIAMRTRAVIEQAKGILMSQRRCNATEAFNLLAAASQRSNRKLRDIAHDIVDGVTGEESQQN